MAEKRKFTFKIHGLHVDVEIFAPSYEEAVCKAYKRYANGRSEQEMRFATYSYCSDCGSLMLEYELREINTDEGITQVLCSDCVCDMEDRGLLTRCECCEDLFAPWLLKENPETDMQEICPLCGEVWCE